MTKMAEMHHIEDEMMLQELMQIARQMMGGQLPMPGAMGSQPGVSQMSGSASTGGQAGGVNSLALPGAGNL
jgi:hypothetical protein